MKGTEYCPRCGAKMVTLVATIDSPDLSWARYRCDNSTCCATFELRYVGEEQAQ